MPAFAERPADADPNSADYGCGYEYDHKAEEFEDDPGHWVCRECGAEGWDNDEDGDTDHG